MSNLRELAQQDLDFVLEDADSGFGWAIHVTDPDGGCADLTGISSDISQLIDVETGAVISGRTALVVLRISSLYSNDLGLPRGIADSTSKPWLIRFNDINGLPYEFKVQKSNPDRTLGVVQCYIEEYS